MVEVDMDWQQERDVLSSNRYMLENHVACDIIFYVGKKRQKLTAHRYVLMSRSSVLYTMLCAPHHQEIGPINIPDIEPEIFEELLRYIYHEAFDPNEKSILPLLYAAKKYAVKSLVNRLKERVCLDNVCIVLQHAHANDDYDLRSRCLEFIIDNGSSVLKHASFRNLSSECVEIVVKQDNLWVKEEEVYEAMKDWAENECSREHIQPSNANMRRLLGGMKNLIRFLVMDEQYFTNKVSVDDILTSDEKVQIFRRFRTGYNRDTTTLENTRREPRFHEMEQVKRFSNISRSMLRGISIRNKSSSMLSEMSGLDAIEFKCSESMLLMGVLINGIANKSCQASTDGEIEVQVLDETKRIMISFTRKIKIPTDTLLKILFDKPLYLKRFWYIITLRMPDCLTSEPGQGGKDVVKMNLEQFIEFRSSSLSRDCTNVSRGQIPGLLICRRRLK